MHEESLLSIVRVVLPLVSFCFVHSAAKAADGDVVVRSLNGTWRFLRDDAELTMASSFAFDDSKWMEVSVPHDWAIGGPFDPNVSGWQGKLPWKGTGWYRKEIFITAAELAAWKRDAKAVYVEFDGVMANPEVWINGEKVGGWDYGYMSFQLEIVRFLRPGRNVVTVRCSTKNLRSRWYPGAGIYRPVRLVVRPEVHVIPGTMNIETPEVTQGRAVVRVRYETKHGKEERSFTVDNPRLWDIDSPNLYTIKIAGETFRYGIRTFRFDKNEGFFLNGRRLQLKGANLHSDMGPLGMAFDRDVMKRQLAIMQDMGVNAIRTSHNAVAPGFLDLCDEMGFFVWNECFDKWFKHSGCGDLEKFEWYIVRNLRQFVRRDRNHPSVFCWSIGNEIDPVVQDKTPTGMTTGRFRIFRSAIRLEDETRPVAIGCCRGNAVGHPEVDFGALDLTGWNYGGKYRKMHDAYPEMPVLCSESASAVSEYGFYEWPMATNKTDYARATLQVGSYDRNAAPWGDIPDVEFDRMARDRYCCGEFIWTGIDYLGEPTPITNGKEFGIQTNASETARSSYFGAVDLCGIPKDRFYLYRSHWNDKSKTVHLLPHWNWTGREGMEVPVYVYTSGDEAELFLNGISLGRRRKCPQGAGRQNSYYGLCDRYRLCWEDVRYVPGELKAIAYAKGVAIGEDVVRTASNPVAVRLTADPYDSAGAKTRFIQVDVIDEAGIRDPLATNRVRFCLKGPGRIVAVGNANPRGLDSFADIGSHPLYYGKAVVVVRFDENSDAPLLLTGAADGLKTASFEVRN